MKLNTWYACDNAFLHTANFCILCQDIYPVADGYESDRFAMLNFSNEADCCDVWTWFQSGMMGPAYDDHMFRILKHDTHYSLEVADKRENILGSWYLYSAVSWMWVAPTDVTEIGPID